MNPRHEARHRMAKLVVAVLLTAAAVMCWRFVLGGPSFDPDEVARAETRMWQAYYSGDRTKLGLQLVSLLRKQHGLSFIEAKEIGELLASSAMKFHAAKGDYESVALGELTEAYRLIKRASGRAYDPEKAARAELSWWVARRTPGQDSVEQVGQRIAGLYAILHGTEDPSFLAAGLLRAEAAALRDAGREDADWARVEELLRQSYRKLEGAL